MATTLDSAPGADFGPGALQGSVPLAHTSGIRNELAIHLLLPPETADAEYFGSADAAKLGELADGVVAHLERFSRFPRGWDGYDAEPFLPHTIAKAKSLVGEITSFFAEYSLVPEEFSAGPASDGSVDIEVGMGGKSLVVIIGPEPTETEISLNDRKSGRSQQPWHGSPLMARFLARLVQ